MSDREATPLRKLTAEAVGTAMLLIAVVGSGIMGERLAAGNTAVALLANSLATGAALAVLILIFGPVSGAHFNPVVTLSEGFERGRWRHIPTTIAAQIVGALAGVALANLMFDLPPFFASTHVRTGTPLLLGEALATFGLLATIHGCSRFRPNAVFLAVAAYITGAYWFTSSTSFANPAVTLARAATDTFSGIRPIDAPGFIAAQLVGAVLATVLCRWLFSSGESSITTAVPYTFRARITKNHEQ
ncbi:MAG TPA: MIP/aquaporin family protein [Terriglobia bacterium]|nr:MIP/aquaporin family protein [Terriglobia bacterium]